MRRLEWVDRAVRVRVEMEDATVTASFWKSEEEEATPWERAREALEPYADAAVVRFVFRGFNALALTQVSDIVCGCAAGTVRFRVAPGDLAGIQDDTRERVGLAGIKARWTRRCATKWGARHVVRLLAHIDNDPDNIAARHAWFNTVRPQAHLIAPRLEGVDKDHSSEHFVHAIRRLASLELPGFEEATREVMQDWATRDSFLRAGTTRFVDSEPNRVVLGEMRAEAASVGARLSVRTVRLVVLPHLVFDTPPPPQITVAPGGRLTTPHLDRLARCVLAVAPREFKAFERWIADLDAVCAAPLADTYSEMQRRILAQLGWVPLDAEPFDSFHDLDFPHSNNAALHCALAARAVLACVRGGSRVCVRSPLDPFRHLPAPHVDSFAGAFRDKIVFPSCILPL